MLFNLQQEQDIDRTTIDIIQVMNGKNNTYIRASNKLSNKILVPTEIKQSIIFKVIVGEIKIETNTGGVG